MNEQDSRILAGILTQEGYQEVEDVKDADIIVVNSCSVRESAENHILGYIGNLKHDKEERGAIIALCGCMAQRSGVAEMIFRRSPQVDIVLGTYHLHHLPQHIAEVLAGAKHIVDIDGGTEDLPVNLPVKQDNPFKGQVNIIHGCNNFCTYCIVPHVRGREKSRPLSAVLDEVRALAAQGVKEVMLLGQNVNSYGLDGGSTTDFAGLLKEIHKIEGIQRIRFMTSHPKDFSKPLIDTIAQLPKVCRQFHLPVQSGCDKILSAMHRRYTTADYWDMLCYIRETFSDATITTDIMVGFPGETEADFIETLAFVERCQFDVAYTFIYSKRSGTPAAKYPDQVPLAVKKERLDALMARQNPISLALNETLIGKTLPVLVEGISKNNAAAYAGRTEGNKIVSFAGTPEMIGQILPVKITAAKTWSLTGDVQ